MVQYCYSLTIPSEPALAKLTDLFLSYVQYDIAKVAALLHRAADLEEVPTMKEVKYLLPKPALTVRDVKPPQWVNMVQSAWPEVASLTSLQAKAQVLGEC